DPGPVFHAADVVVLTSRTEGLPAVLVEAGLCGVPVVATDVGFVRDVVVDGHTGVVVPFGDRAAIDTGIRRALEEGDRMGPAARARCEAHFSLATVGDVWNRLLEHMG